MAVLEPYRGNYYLWKYLPSLEGAAISAALFGIVTIAHTLRLSKNRSWFAIPFPIGGMMEVIGFATRAVAREKTGQLMPYVIQNTNILLAPVFFAASIYMTLGRLIRMTNGERHSIISLKWLTKIFVTGDVLSLMVQGGGAGMMVMDDFAQMAEKIVIGGLLIQIIIFGLFIITVTMFHIRMRRDPVSKHAVAGGFEWEPTIWMLYIVSVLVMGRSIFRVAEFVMGTDGYLLSHEWPLYLFDALPMFAVMAVFWYWWPMTSLRRSSWASLRSLNQSHTRL
ncbi:hypothetical protein BHE90_006585 [Fusarium euwallaceae]|uniref:Uncharacterized protein n=3 Tax=Fusarium solani species complex TaxID=232080 RepID=A0A428SEQ8_9HYPO|nr:hypothetical protein CEP52_015279 [Fusarium oligoseptatum]RSM08241.1 hypothetical protein CDV31_008249 [Fusarium ambrosium]RTE78924.1 hypothetical protein BHE90_006585 [Fusarium euwallaceae]